jgi:hypothetical protein
VSKLTSIETFKAYSNEEMFAEYLVNKFTKTRVAGRLLTKNIALFLEYRMNALYDVLDKLPSVVRKTVAVIMDITEETTQESHSRYTSEVTVAVAQHGEDTLQPIRESIFLYTY